MDLNEFIENFEQLDELSRGTLLNYIKKAKQSEINSLAKGFASDDRDDTKKAFRKAANRILGAKKANNKLMKKEDLDEAAYSAKAAREGKDIGKPGKNFEKIEKSAAKEYGSEAAGKRVAGAILAKIRAKHMKEDIDIIEAYEQLDEISKGKLVDYISRAVSDVHTKAHKSGLDKGVDIGRGRFNSETGEEDSLKARKRAGGIRRASRMLANKTESVEEMDINELIEAYEQLDELSKETLASYIKKSAGSAAGNAMGAGMIMNSDVKKAIKDSKVVGNRLNGIRKATDKLLKKEEVEVNSEEVVDEGKTYRHEKDWDGDYDNSPKSEKEMKEKKKESKEKETKAAEKREVKEDVKPSRMDLVVEELSFYKKR